MKNDNNTKGLNLPIELDKTQEGDVAGGKRFSVQELCGKDFVDLWFEESDTKGVPRPKGDYESDGYFEFDENDPENLDKWRMVASWKRRVKPEDLTSSEKKALKQIGIL